MTLFAKLDIKSGLRPALLCAVFASFAASTAIAGNVVPVPGDTGAKKQQTSRVAELRPRNRIATHPRNKNRPVKTYRRGNRKVRVVDTSRSTTRAPRTAFNAQRSGLFTDNFERLERQFLRESIDAVELNNERRRANLDFIRRAGNRGAFDGDTIPRIGREIYFAPVSPTEGVLREAVNNGPLRPNAGIIRVTESQKIIGERRAAARARRYNREDTARYFRFYRPNEAYDVRFPSVVYLTSR